VVAVVVAILDLVLDYLVDRAVELDTHNQAEVELGHQVKEIQVVAVVQALHMAEVVEAVLVLVELLLLA
jgi:hypothetical protein